MKRFTRYAFGAAGLFALVSAVLLTAGWGSAVASNVSGVFVTNTASNPLPVSGTVSVGSIGGGATVDVGNTPSVKLDPTGNTVQLASHLGQQALISGTFSFNGAAIQDFTVPAGKAFVIEHVSARVTANGGEGAELDAKLAPAGGGLPYTVYLPLEAQPGFGQGGSLSLLVLDEDVTLVAGPGANTLTIAGSGSGVDGRVDYTLYGYLVDAPA